MKKYLDYIRLMNYENVKCYDDKVRFTRENWDSYDFDLADEILIYFKEDHVLITMKYSRIVETIIGEGEFSVKSYDLKSENCYMRTRDMERIMNYLHDGDYDSFRNWLSGEGEKK